MKRVLSIALTLALLFGFGPTAIAQTQETADMPIENDLKVSASQNEERDVIRGDLDGSGAVDTDDAIYLLYHTLFGEGSYPINQPCDLDSSGAVDTDDAIYLLYHTLFGSESYPLPTANVVEDAVKTYGVGQFVEQYTVGDAVELETDASVFGQAYSAVELSYASSDASVVELVAVDGVMQMQCLKAGYATITITGTYGEETYAENVTILVAPEGYVETTIAELYALSIREGNTTTQRYYVRATVDSITDSTYGAMKISDATGEISVYSSYDADGSVRYAEMANKPYKGDEVILYATVQNYYGTYEIKSAYIIAVRHDEPDVSEYTEMTIADARDAAIDTKVKVTGVVARLTYAPNHMPGGLILVDGTSSIYISDVDLAGRVSVGNTITVAASKNYWITETEIANAEKFGYIGCNQLEDAWLLNNDNGNSDFDKSWIEETTVQDIVNTSVSEDITTKIYKVTAQIRKVDGSWYTNYYIYDLDGTTGSYVYTMCSGWDFAWLDEFDGKVCTVYMVALNAKCASSRHNWRFLPIAVMDENFDISNVNVPENAVRLYGVPQFENSYDVGATIDVQSSVNNELLEYTDVALTYVSSDPAVIEFSTVDGQMVMNCLRVGSATVTVTATYNGETYSQNIILEVNGAPEVDYVDVKTAIEAGLDKK